MKIRKYITTCISLILVAALCLQLVPVQVFADSSGTDVPVDTAAALQDDIPAEYCNVFSEDGPLEANDDTVLYEVEERREESVKHFALTDGSIVAAMYGSPVHEMDDSGNWVDIDNTLTASTDSDGEASLSKQSGKNKVFFANKAKEGKLLTISTDYGKISWSLDGVSGNVRAASYTEPDVEANNTKMAVRSVSGVVAYNDVLPGVNLEYQMIGNDIKENIVLTDKSAVQAFSFALECKKMTARLENNRVVIYSPEGKVVRTISAPYMVDANGITSQDIVLSLTEDDKGYTVTVTPDEEWLLDEERTYPVIIDPTITFPYDSSQTNNTTVYSKSPNSTSLYQNGRMHVGLQSGTYENMRGMLYLPLPTTLKESDMIVDAALELTQQGFIGSSGESVTINVHQITSNVWASDITWYNSYTSYSSTVLDSQEATSATTGTRLIWDITAAVKSWYQNGNNYGLEFISENEGSTYKYASFYTNRYVGATSDKFPCLTITYLNHEGLEDYLTYHQAGSGTMGTISVGDFNGNLIYTYTDLSMDGNYLPVTIQHVYNHSQRSISEVVSSGMYYGLGMRLNLSQKIEPSSVTGYPYKYTDADGTVHYFSLQSGTSGAVGSVYEKENESTTTITSTSSGYTLSDGGTMEYRFNTSGFLASVVDTANSKSLTLGYTNNRLTSVTDGVGRVTTLAYSGNYLSSITDPAGRVTSYTYSNGALTQITRPDGTRVMLTYTSSNSTYMLTGIQDIDGSKVNISYYSYSPHRVKTLTEYGSSGGEGNKLTWTYTAGETTVTDRDGRQETMMFDYSGHTVCIRDSEGNAVYGAYNNTENDNKNTLQYQSNMQSSVTNYLKNHDFEDSTFSPWTKEYISASGTLGIYTTEKYSGNQSLRMKSNSTSGRLGWAQAIEVPDCNGMAITISVMVKITEITTTSAEASGFRLSLGYTDAYGNVATSVGQAYKLTTDWQRMSHTFVIPYYSQSDTVTMYASLHNAIGTVFIDNAQLEVSPVSNRYNLLDNGHFRDILGLYVPASWTGNALNTTTDYVVAGRSGKGFQIAGESGKNKYLYQSIPISGKAGDTYVFGAWAKALSIAKIDKTTGAARTFGVQLQYVLADGSTKALTLDFEAKSPNWQYAAGSFTAPSDFVSIRILLLYCDQKNTVIFDDAQLYYERFGTLLDYDDYGRVTSSTDSMGRTTTYTYVADKRPEISQITYSDGTTTTYTYDTATWRLLSVTDANGSVADYSYDTNGNLTNVATTANGLTLSGGTTTYSGSYISSTTDTFGNTISYNYNQNKGTLNSVTDAKNNVTSYTYNANNDYMTKVSASGSEVDYTYSNGRLATITHNTDSTAANDVTYSFVYDQFGNTSSVKVGSQALITHTYEANNGNLSRSDYGNGDYYVPTYDAIDRLHSVSYNGVESYNWEYGADGRVGLHNDLVNGVTWMYEYANDGSLTSVVGDNGERFVYTYEPSTGKLLTRTVYDGTISRTTTYNYSDHTNGEKANLVESVVLPTATVTYDYDDFYRASYDVEVSGNDILTTGYTFRNGSAANSTSLMVENMYLTGNGWSTTFTYAYDANGNITYARDYGVPKGIYEYDELNQLVRENNMWLNKTITYTYDSGGNIQAVKEYSYTAGSLDSATPTTTYTYVYGDSNWKDKLTSYNGNAITYDAIGNPLTYYNGYTFEWQNGRQLAGVTGNSQTISYTYNADGIRTSKTVNGVTTNYTLEGSNVVMETNGTDTLWFYYDASGSLTGFELNGTPYFYVKNAQGDIIAITDASGTKVVEYLYDSWGKLISTTGSLASTVGVKNPYRYRGYRYDTETGLYYLQSRYYDPVVKRFINADKISLLGANGDFASLNLFSYCGNHPISRADSGGYFWNVVVGAVVGGIISGVVAAVSSHKQTGSIDWESVAINTAVGAISGAVAATGLGVWAQAGITAVVSGAGNFAEQCFSGGIDNVNYLDVALSAGIGGGMSLLGSGVGKLLGGKLKTAGEELINKGRDKLLTGYVREIAGQSHSALYRQGAKYLTQGSKTLNTFYGLSSSVGSILSGGASYGYNVFKDEVLGW